MKSQEKLFRTTAHPRVGKEHPRIELYGTAKSLLVLRKALGRLPQCRDLDWSVAEHNPEEARP